jgi:hypothetical protein
MVVDFLSKPITVTMLDYLLNKLNKEDLRDLKCCGKYKKAMFVFQNYMKIHDSPVKFSSYCYPNHSWLFRAYFLQKGDEIPTLPKRR